MANLSSNVAIWMLAGIAPGLLMVGGHYFPWAATPLGKLTENQARVYGVLGIVLPVMMAVSLGETLGILLTAWQVIGLIWLAAISAGLATIWVWGIDEKLRLQQDITAEKHRSELLRSHAEARDIERLLD